MSKANILLCFFAVSAVAWAPSSLGNVVRGWTPSREQVAKLEARLVLPYGAKPLAAYARYYAGIGEGLRRKIFGYLVVDAGDEFAEPGRPGTVHIISIDDMPILHGGRCRVISVVFDIEAQTFDRATCDGDR